MISVITNSHQSNTFPTSRACYYNYLRFTMLRVHIHVAIWCALRPLLCRDEFGFKRGNGTLVPIITDNASAPSETLRKICCSCKSANRFCTACTCLKNRLPGACTTSVEDNVVAFLRTSYRKHESECNQTSGLHFTQVHCVSLLHHAWCACPV